MYGYELRNHLFVYEWCICGFDCCERSSIMLRIIVVRMLVVIQQHLEMALVVLAMKVLLVLLERTSARHVWRPRAMVWTVVLVLSVARAPQAMDTSVCVMKHISTM